MAHQWIKTIRGVPNLHYVVAPYEVSAFKCSKSLNLKPFAAYG